MATRGGWVLGREGWVRVRVMGMLRAYEKPCKCRWLMLYLFNINK